MTAKTTAESDRRSVLSPGHNCWRITQADRCAVVIDADDYFAAFKSVCRRAENAIFILGWDFDRRERLGREKDDSTLEDFLNQLLEDNDHLHIYLLLWDFHLVYARERELLQGWRLRSDGHERLHVHMDSRHPPGASHHQKLVIVDDATAFCGGIDLSRWRWDTSAHAGGNSGRTDPDGNDYAPFHDLMMLVQGDTAATLGEVARDRWQRSGATPVPVAAAAPERAPWPDGTGVLFKNQAVGVARTYGAFDSQDAIREIEQLYCDAVKNARDYIYIENQYFTSRELTRALAARLRQDDSPEVVLVLPYETGNWMEQLTMDELRQRRLQVLREADRHDRLRVYYPAQPGLGAGEHISVHTKLMIIDDTFLTLGSANASDRSMGLDSECNLALETEQGSGVATLLQQLLAEHLGCPGEAFQRSRERYPGLIEAVEALRRPDARSLRELNTSVDNAVVDIGNDDDLIDPYEPIDSQYFVDRAVPAGRRSEGKRQLLFFVGFLVCLLGLALAWRWTPLAESINVQDLARSLPWLEQPLLRAGVAVFALVLASLLMVPLSLLAVAAGLALGPWVGFACVMCGALVSAAIAFWAGQAMGGQVIERFSGSNIHTLSKRLSQQGIMATAVLRLLPVAPYTIVNLTAGASHLKLGQFMVGSAIGLIPGMAALTLFSGSLYDAFINPSARSLGILAFVALVIAAAALLLRRLLENR